MVKNNKGVTIIELLAVIVLTSIIIAPLMSSLISNINKNTTQHVRRSAVSLSDGALYGFDKLNYGNLSTMLNSSSDSYLEFDVDSCDQSHNGDDLSLSDQSICQIVFGSQFNSVSFDADHFKVYIYPYNMDVNTIQTLSDNHPVIEKEVQDEIGTIAPANGAEDLLRISVWILYQDDPRETTVISGLLIGDWTGS